MNKDENVPVTYLKNFLPNFWVVLTIENYQIDNLPSMNVGLRTITTALIQQETSSQINHLGNLRSSVPPFGNSF